DDDTLRRAKQTEPFGYLVKPYEEKELSATIEMALQKHRLESSLQAESHWLATTLQTIKDAVIAADSSEKIRFMNRSAELLTGWKCDEVLDLEIAGVFVLKDGLTRDFLEKVEVLRGRPGVAVDLPADSVLTARNGKQTPVEAGAFRLQDETGV